MGLAVIFIGLGMLGSQTFEDKSKNLKITIWLRMVFWVLAVGLIVYSIYKNI